MESGVTSLGRTPFSKDIKVNFKTSNMNETHEDEKVRTAGGVKGAVLD